MLPHIPPRRQRDGKLFGIDRQIDIVDVDFPAAERRANGVDGERQFVVRVLDRLSVNLRGHLFFIRCADAFKQAYDLRCPLHCY